AATNVLMLEIGREMFRTRMEEVPKWLQAFFEIIVERLRIATKNQSTLLARGAGRQVVNLLALLANREEPDSQERIILPWNKSIAMIGFYIGLNEERINDTVNELVSLHLAASDRREGIGRVFILDAPDKFFKFAEFCRECHMLETGHIKEMSEEFAFKDKQEVELLQVLDEIIKEQGTIEDFPANTLAERLEEKYKASFKVYQPSIEGLIRAGIISSFSPEGGEPAYRMDNRELFNEKLAKIQLLIEFRDFDKKIMG
ncbi:MAG: Crp/Fnr family transcriptional regulator, partial [Fidelibacterota bacterium]